MLGYLPHLCEISHILHSSGEISAQSFAEVLFFFFFFSFSKIFFEFWLLRTKRLAGLFIHFHSFSFFLFIFIHFHFYYQTIFF